MCTVKSKQSVKFSPQKYKSRVLYRTGYEYMRWGMIPYISWGCDLVCIMNGVGIWICIFVWGGDTKWLSVSYFNIGKYQKQNLQPSSSDAMRLKIKAG